MAPKDYSNDSNESEFSKLRHSSNRGGVRQNYDSQAPNDSPQTASVRHQHTNSFIPPYTQTYEDQDNRYARGQSLSDFYFLQSPNQSPDISAFPGGGVGVNTNNNAGAINNHPREASLVRHVRTTSKTGSVSKKTHNKRRMQSRRVNSIDEFRPSVAHAKTPSVSQVAYSISRTSSTRGPTSPSLRQNVSSGLPSVSVAGPSTPNNDADGYAMAYGSPGPPTWSQTDNNDEKSIKLNNKNTEERGKQSLGLGIGITVSPNNRDEPYNERANSNGQMYPMQPQLGAYGSPYSAMQSQNSIYSGYPKIKNDNQSVYHENYRNITTTGSVKSPQLSTFRSSRYQGGGTSPSDQPAPTGQIVNTPGIPSRSQSDVEGRSGAVNLYMGQPGPIAAPIEQHGRQSIGLSPTVPVDPGQVTMEGVHEGSSTGMLSERGHPSTNGQFLKVPSNSNFPYAPYNEAYMVPGNDNVTEMASSAVQVSGPGGMVGTNAANSSNVTELPGTIGSEAVTVAISGSHNDSNVPSGTGNVTTGSGSVSGVRNDQAPHIGPSYITGEYPQQMMVVNPYSPQSYIHHPSYGTMPDRRVLLPVPGTVPGTEYPERDPQGYDIYAPDYDFEYSSRMAPFNEDVIMPAQPNGPHQMSPLPPGDARMPQSGMYHVYYPNQNMPPNNDSRDYYGQNPYANSYETYNNDREEEDTEDDALLMKVPGPNYSTEVHTMWTNEQIEDLIRLLEPGERHKWKYMSETLTEKQNKRISMRACKSKFESMFGETEASSLLQSSLFYTTYTTGWEAIKSECTKQEKEEMETANTDSEHTSTIKKSSQQENSNPGKFHKDESDTSNNREAQSMVSNQLSRNI